MRMAVSQGVGDGPEAQPGSREHSGATNRSSLVAGVERRGEEKGNGFAPTERTMSEGQWSSRGWRCRSRCAGHVQPCVDLHPFVCWGLTGPMGRL